jgi:hypothetical protein
MKHSRNAIPSDLIMRSTTALTSIFAAGLILAAAAVAADPARPDFSGRWELDLEKSEGLPPGTKQIMTVQQTGDRLEVELQLSGGPAGERTLRDTYVINGEPAEFTPAMMAGDMKPKKGTRTATWAKDGSGIDVREEATLEGPEGTDTVAGERKWRLAGGGKMLTIDIDMEGKGGAMKGKRVYQKG